MTRQQARQLILVLSQKQIAFWLKRNGNEINVSFEFKYDYEVYRAIGSS